MEPSIAIVNQVSNKTFFDKVGSTTENSFGNTSTEQYHQLMNMLSNHLSFTKDTDQPDTSSTSHKDTNIKRMIGKAKKFQNLYVLDVDKLPTGPTSGSVTAQVNLIPIQTWHNRLGYLSSKVLDVLRPQL